MKKLTAGIFTVLMGLVTVNAAEAAVASKGYVDEKVGGATSSIATLTQTVADNKTAAETAIADAKKAGTDAAAALESYKTTNDGAVSGLDTRLGAAEDNITALQGTVGELSGDGANSVANQIANALAAANGYTDAEVKELADGAVKTNTEAIAAINNETTGILAEAKGYADSLATNYDAAGSATTALTNAKAYTDTEIGKIDAAYKEADTAINNKIGTVAEGETVVQMIEAAQTAATYDDAEVRGLIADNASDISDNAAAIATKLTNTATISENGKYVLTAVTVGDDTTYAWELITRETGTEQE